MSKAPADKEAAKAYYKRVNERRKAKKLEEAAKYAAEQERARKEAEAHARNVDRGKYGNEVKHTVVEVRRKYVKQGEYKPPEGQS